MVAALAIIHLLQDREAPLHCPTVASSLVGSVLKRGALTALLLQSAIEFFIRTHSDCDESVNVKLSILTEHLSRLMQMCHGCAGKNNHQPHEPLHHTITQEAAICSVAPAKKRGMLARLKYIYFVGSKQLFIGRPM